MEHHASPEVGAEESLSIVRKHHLFLASLVGLGVGGIAVAFEWLSSSISRLQNDTAVVFTGHGANIAFLVVFCGVVGGLVGSLTQRVAPEAGGSGIPHVKAVLSHLQSLRGIRVMMVKFFGGALVIGSKFSLGREGPTVHIGASLADEVGKRAGVPPHLRDHLIACGAGAGLAAAFNAPLAGFLFVIEELRREVNSITLGMALLGTVIADAVVQFSLGARPMLQLSDIVLPSLETGPAILIISAVATFGGLLFNQALVRGVAKAPVEAPLWARGVVVGCLVGACIHFLPMIVLDEQEVFRRFSAGTMFSEISILTLGSLFVAKPLLTAACYATGVPGGIFAPMLVQGAFVGFLMAKVLALTPLDVPNAEVSALLGMTAFFAASVRAPFTGVVLLAEMTDGFSLLLPLMVAALMGYVVAELLGTKPIYERLLATSTQASGQNPEAS